MNPETCRGPADEARDICEDFTYGYIRNWLRRHPGAPVIGYLPAYAPRELIYAAGGLAVGVWGGGPLVEIVHGDAYYQSYICHLPRSVIEMASAGYFQDFSGMIFPSTCDVIRNLSGMWQRLFPHQWSYYLDFPQNFHQKTGGEFYRKQLIRLAARIQGGSPDADYREKLRQAIALTNRQQAVLQRLRRFRSSFPEKIPVGDYYYLLRSALVLHPAEHIRKVDAYLNAASAGAVSPSDHVRCVLIGAFCEQPPAGLLRTIENAGCSIVDDDLITGLHWFTSSLSEVGDPFQSLVNGYLEQTGIAPFKYQDHTDRGEDLLRRVQASRADGVILAAPSFCDPVLLERPILKKALDHAGIPSAAFKYSEGSCQYQGVSEITGTLSDTIRLWGKDAC